MSLTKSASMPGLMGVGTAMPKMLDHKHHKKTTLAYRTGGGHGAVDFLGGHPNSLSEASLALAAHMKADPAWRHNLDVGEPNPVSKPEDMVAKNTAHPRVAPAWLKHDKHCLRFYAYFQEAVVERPDENCRYRCVSIMIHMEDGSLSIAEPKMENSGIPQGAFLKRHRVPREDGMGFIGPDDFKCGETITIYGRTFHITGCDRYTRWFYSENGIDVGDDEPMVQDQWQKNYRFNKTVEQGGIPLSKSSVEAKTLTKYQVGQPPADMKFTQFLLNDRKVLRFKGFWDDHTHYGARIYMEIQYFLSDNTVLVNEQHCRNSGRDNFPVFMKRGPLYKENSLVAYPGMLVKDPEKYMPEDFVVGEAIYIWGRKVMLYDCDDFTQNFYEEYMGVDQKDGKIDVSEKRMQHRKLAPPPHNGIGTEEDSLMNVHKIQPKAAKVDAVKLMTESGEMLRFEAKFADAEPEDRDRKFVIAFYPQDDSTAVFEIQQRNSGHMGGKFADKRSGRKNPETGKYWALDDFRVGRTVEMISQRFYILRADEHCLQYLEARPDKYPYADPWACARLLAPLAGESELQDPAGLDPDHLKEIAAQKGIFLEDHEVITLLRSCPVADSEVAKISGPSVLSLIS